MAAAGPAMPAPIIRAVVGGEGMVLDLGWFREGKDEGWEKIWGCD